EAQHDVRPPAPDHAKAVDACTQERERPEHQRTQALAADAAKRHRFEVDAMRRHEPRFHAVARTEPEDATAARDQFRGHGEAREHVSAGAAGGDHYGRRHSTTLGLAAWDDPAPLIA